MSISCSRDDYNYNSLLRSSEVAREAAGSRDRAIVYVAGAALRKFLQR